MLESIDEHRISAGEATEKQPRKGVNAAETSTQKGKTPAGKAEKSCKVAGDHGKPSRKQAAQREIKQQNKWPPLLPPIQLRK